MLCCSYIDSSQEDLITDSILDDIYQFNENEDVYYMLTDDFNARTSVFDDCLQVDLSLHIPVLDDYKVDTVFEKRTLQDFQLKSMNQQKAD